jgi:hypothetical protein
MKQTKEQREAAKKARNENLVALQLPPQVRVDLEKAAEKLHISKSAIVRQGLKDILSEFKVTGTIKIS